MRPTWDEIWMDIADVVGKRSLCDRDQVGAVVVSSTNRILETGYNGPPAGFVRTAGGREANHLGCTFWCARAANARDTYAQMHEGLSPNYADCPSLHAEQNALMFGDRVAREGGTLYVSSGVCSTCAKLIANSGLAAVVMRLRKQDTHRDTERWVDFLFDCGINTTVIEAP